MTRPMQSLEDLHAAVIREVRTLALLDRPITYALPPAHVVPLERIVVSALLDGWADLADVEGLEPEHFADRLLGHLYAFARSARDEGRSYSDAAVAQAFERGGYCRADRLRALLETLRLHTAAVGTEPLREAAARIVAVAKWRAFAAEVAKVDAALRHAASAGEEVDAAGAFEAAAQALEASR